MRLFYIVQRVTTLENSLDKAFIKYDTARIISKKYKDILDNLKEVIHRAVNFNNPSPPVTVYTRKLIQ